MATPGVIPPDPHPATKIFHLFPEAPMVVVFAGVAVLLNAVPLVWHFRTRNLAAAGLVSWIVLLNIFTCINAAIWAHSNAHEWWNGIGYCDISTSFIVGFQIGVPGAVACLFRKLTKIVSPNSLDRTQGKDEKRRDDIMLLSLCLVLPLTVMGLTWLVRAYRYIIMPIGGCDIALRMCWESLIFIWLWPVTLTILDTFYAGKSCGSSETHTRLTRVLVPPVLLTFRLVRYRRQFGSLLHNANTTKSRFTKLTVMLFVFVVSTLPLRMVEFVIVLRMTIQSNVFFDPGPTAWQIINSAPPWRIFKDRWVIISMGFLSFGFLGSGQEVRSIYRGWFQKLRLLLHIPALSVKSRSSHESTSASLFQGWRMNKDLSPDSTSTSTSLSSQKLLTATGR